jgi:hypothetical protein
VTETNYQPKPKRQNKHDQNCAKEPVDAGSCFPNTVDAVLYVVDIFSFTAPCGYVRASKSEGLGCLDISSKATATAKPAKEPEDLSSEGRDRSTNMRQHRVL